MPRCRYTAGFNLNQHRQSATVELYRRWRERLYACGSTRMNCGSIVTEQFPQAGKRHFSRSDASAHVPHRGARARRTPIRL